MHLSLFIARRYFRSLRATFIHTIAWISMGLMGAGTLALVVALSAFNGMTHLLRTHYAAFDPEIRIQAREGHFFSMTKAQKASLSHMRELKSYSPVIEEVALLTYDQSQSIVKMKGISPTFLRESTLGNYLAEGSLSMTHPNDALLGIGIQNALSVPFQSPFKALHMHYPTDPIVANPQHMYRTQTLTLKGTFQLHRPQDDEYVIIPIELARTLTGRPNAQTAIELSAHDPNQIPQIKQSIQTQWGDDFDVLTREQMHADLYQLLRIEKRFVFLIFSFVLIISSLSLFFMLSLMVFDKTQDIKIWHALGLSPAGVGRIFLWEGIGVSVLGALGGMTLGLVLCALQAQYGFINLAVIDGVAHRYPVRVEPMDLLGIAAAVFGVALLASVPPARRAARLCVRPLTNE